MMQPVSMNSATQTKGKRESLGTKTQSICCGLSPLLRICVRTGGRQAEGGDGQVHWFQSAPEVDGTVAQRLPAGGPSSAPMQSGHACKEGTRSRAPLTAPLPHPHRPRTTKRTAVARATSTPLSLSATAPSTFTLPSLTPPF